MATWDNSANSNMATVKAQTNASDQQMAGLLAQISAWANTHPNGNTQIPFGNLRDHHVTVVTSGGMIKSVTYGDR